MPFIGRSSRSFVFPAETIRAHFPTLGIAGETNVVGMKKKARGHGAESSNSLPS
jgi:hypothetical protein